MDKAAFKNLGRAEDTLRSKRRDAALSLRKVKREEENGRRRMVTEVLDAEAIQFIQSATDNDIDVLCQRLQAPKDLDELYDTVHKIRQLLSRSNRPPIDRVIRSGAVPVLVKILEDVDSPEVQFEATWALTNIASGSSEQTEVVIDSNAIGVFMRLIHSPHPNVQEQAIWAIGNIAGDSPQYRDAVLAMGAMDVFIQAIETAGSNQSMVKNATWALSNLCRGKNPYPDFGIVSRCIPILCRLLQLEDEGAVMDACWTISYLSEGHEDKVQTVIDTGIVPRIIELLQHDDPSIQIPALRTVGNIITGTTEQTQFVLDMNILPTFHILLNHSSLVLRKEACWTLSNIAAGTREQIQLLIDAGLIPPLVHILNLGDERSRKEAAWTISNLAVTGSDEQVEVIVEAGCIEPLIKVLGFPDLKVPLFVMDGLAKIFLVGAQKGRENLYLIEFQEADGLQVLEKLVSSENTAIMKKAFRLLDQFFPVFLISPCFLPLDKFFSFCSAYANLVDRPSIVAIHSPTLHH
eukprot:m.255473 g.255473  ORF g.255473 m.255473 type:complete len:520 (+) comp54542_c1_seq7:720-2279(+)